MAFDPKLGLTCLLYLCLWLSEIWQKLYHLCLTCWIAPKIIFWGLYQKRSMFRTVLPEMEDLWMSSQHKRSWSGAERYCANTFWGLKTQNVSTSCFNWSIGSQWQRVTKINKDNSGVLSEAIKFQSNDQWNLGNSLEVDSSQPTGLSW